MGPDLVKRLIDRSAGHAPRHRSTRLTGRPTRALVDPWAPGGREYEHEAAAAEATEWHAIMASLGPVPVDPDPEAERWVAARTAADLAARATDDPENDPAAEPPEPEWVQHLDDPRVIAALDALDPDHDDSAPDADPGRVAALLDGLAPGPDLARVLAGLDPTTLDEAALVEMTAAAQRQGAWSHALAARAAAELAGRATMTPHWNPAAGPAPRAANVAPDELVMRLCCSRRTATTLIAQGQAFSGALVATGEALAAGEIDPIRARVLTDRLALVPGEVAWQVEDRVLADADRRSLTEFRRDVERALLEVDPTDAHERHERARTTRRVDRPRVLPDGMAGLWAVLPARQATRIHHLLDASARTARSAGDPRTLDHLRADGLCDLLLPHTTTPAHSTTGDTGDGTTATATRTTGEGHIATGTRTTGEGHIATGDGATPTGTQATAAAPGAPHRCAGKVETHVTIPWTTALGISDAPGYLDGYGPIDAHQARALAFEAGGVWRRLITDDLTGTVLDLGRTRYRPPAPLAEHIRARDKQCARPGCTAPAAGCDLDHTIEYHRRTAPDPESPALGTTSAGNLGPLCRRDHRLKTDGGFTLRQVQPGVFHWTTPAGNHYAVIPGAHGYNERLGNSSWLPTRPAVGPPPF